MGRQFSTKNFFRQMPKNLLGRYFAAKGLFDNFDFASMSEGKPDTLFEAWLALPHDQRNMIDAEFRDVFDLCCDKGFLATLDEARWQLRDSPEALADFTAKLSSLPSHFERAMVT